MRYSREFDQRRAVEQPWRHWYWTARWRRIAKHQLALQPLCASCLLGDKVKAASVCDHVLPHRGDATIFWEGPFQSLCKACHDSTKQREDKRGHVLGCDAAGRPLDPGHPWNAGG